ncbi:hypothetical protein L3C95_24940 [Chitinophaga filiformis]|uniref:hypothetical protein n=1 Tax=Chitinophaga filiformis TaxID=104663 RepID=UPI001F1DD272|nr:hypothetical protein [Chitinophaga filiformis]MCF6406166.1 hypothetical protein [Chitinophaga filiformis]
MNKLVLALLTIGLLAGCGSKKKNSGKDTFTFEDFRQLFTQAKLPYKLTPETLREKSPDSAAISPELMKQFLIDTLGRSDFPEGTVIRFYPLATIDGAAVNYFVVKAVGKATSTAYICFLDKKGHYLNRMAVAKVDDKKDQHYFSVDTRQVVKITNETEISPGRRAIREDFYGVGEDGRATLIMTNTSGDAVANQIFNPIDTLAATHKLSGDYLSGETSVVSIRDGQDPKSFLFFISFSKDKTGCKGELSGTGHFTGNNKGEYKDKETSCGIAFQFASDRVSIKEIGGCGAYRGVRCFFEGSYKKKKK